jgi:AraC-like DNA-binding protein
MRPSDSASQLESDFGQTRDAVASVCDSEGLQTHDSRSVLWLVEAALASLTSSPREATQHLRNATAILTQEKELFPDELVKVNPSGPLLRWQLRRVVDMIDANLAKGLCIGDIATVVSLSKGYFSEAFRRTTGESPFTYIRRRRISRAQQMMLLTNKSLAEIAVDCGLSDQAHLTRVFRRVVGTSPGAWRRMHRLRDTQ